MLKQTTSPLSQRIEIIRAEIDAFIDAHVLEIKKTCPGVPEGVLRRDIVRGNCQCVAYLDMANKDEEK